MSTMEPLSSLVGIKSSGLSKEESCLFEADLFIRICEELKEMFREQRRDYFCLMRLTREKENAVLEDYFIRLIINDILSTEEYTLDGIANYTNTPKDVVEDVLTGQNKSPSALFLRRLIELHRNIRHSLYLTIMKKITAEHLAA